MPADPRTDALFEEAQQLLDQLKTAIENKDVAAQLLSTLKLVGVELGFKRIETTKRLMLANMMAAVRRATDPDERRKELLKAFEYTEGARSTAQSELADEALSAEAESQLKAIISGLDGLEPEGRRALAPFLRHRRSRRARLRRGRASCSHAGARHCGSARAGEKCTGHQCRRHGARHPR